MSVFAVYENRVRRWMHTECPISKALRCGAYVKEDHACCDVLCLLNKALKLLIGNEWLLI